MTHWQLMHDAEAVARETCRRISTAADAAIQDHGYFSLVLAGGTTPKRAYELLVQTEQQWDRWHLYYGDERCLPVDDIERNSVMVATTGLADKVSQHHIMPAEQGAEDGAESYADIIDRVLPFDMVLLGIGEDGHTASLFPGHAWPEKNVIPVHHSPKPPSDRISLSIAALQQSHDLLILVTGASKADAVRQWRAGGDLPVARVATATHTQVLIDTSASSD